MDLSGGRMPYPFAAWPESEPRPWENNIEARPSVLRGSINPKVLIRSDPAMHAVGTQLEPMARTPDPVASNRTNIYSNLTTTTSAGRRVDPMDMSNGNIRYDSRDLGRRTEGDRGLMDLILGELESKAPRSFKGIFDILRGRYSLEVRPSAPSTSSLGMVGAVIVFSIARIIRQVIGSIPFASVSLKSSLLAHPSVIFLQSSSAAGLLLLMAGLVAGFVSRNWFMMNAVACRLFSLGGFLLIVSSGTGGEYLLGCFLGTWISVHFVFKQPPTAKKLPREVVKENQPLNWVHERWLPSQWEVQLDNGAWSPFPQSAQDLMEEALKNQQQTVRLNMGEYGEHSYLVDLVSNIATNLTSTDRVELSIRRTPIH